MNKLSVLIVEDHLLLGDAWSFFFNAKTSFSVVGNVSTPGAAIDLVRSALPDVILLDVNLGEVSGIDLIPRFLKESPGSRILVVTVSAYPWLAEKAIHTGAKGFITKNEDFDIMLEAINIVGAGGVFISSAASAVGGNAGPESFSPSLGKITAKEKDVMRYLSQGLNTMQIAEKLNVSRKTIATHRHNAMKKLRVRNVIELINYFLQHFEDRKGS